MIVTSKQMMDKSMELFEKYGYKNVSIERICKELGVTRGSFYHHFKNKNDLLIRWVKELYEKAEDEFEILPDKNPYEQLNDVLLFWAKELESLGHELVHESLMASFDLADQMNYDSIVFRIDKFGTHPEISRKLIIKAQEQGLISKQFSAKKLEEIYTYATIGVCIQWHLMKGSFSLTNEIQLIFIKIFGDGNIDNN